MSYNRSYSSQTFADHGNVEGDSFASMEEEITITGKSGRVYRFALFRMEHLAMLVDPHKTGAVVVVVTDSQTKLVYATYSENGPREGLLRAHMHLRYESGYFGYIRVADFEGASIAGDIQAGIIPA
ncbi:MAG: hypothetical protein JNM62_08150 [Flavobacteriales bacterium]|nr:hypothetical protein [Flavobacteriales bacterium]